MTEEELKAVCVASASHFVALYAFLIKTGNMTYDEVVRVAHTSTIPIAHNEFANQARDIMSAFILQGLASLAGSPPPQSGA